ncbi:hypothetical protein [Halobacterium jilantaiense]|uniref:Competence protein ComEA n=1 Tax=Halobacterium jilantaiense TaxID=355548 RepID=A0A1I0PC73_9EURY|nr:hypothetical protein [Halobacterium jilantaiense]SEW11792.1 competence protein ComEA [Halobacterium jilantaiense]
MSDADAAQPDPRTEMEARGWRVVYKSHDVMAKYNACYNVEYNGDRIAPPAADDLGIPLGEVWVTEFLEPYEKYVLHHELAEIEARADGLGVEAAHERALEADRAAWGDDDPGYQEFVTEINLVPPGRVTALPGCDEELFDAIKRNRPYCDIEELRAVPGVDDDRFDALSDAFWCFDCDL